MEDTEILTECRKALDVLTNASNQSPDQIQKDARTAAHAVARARDILIAQLHEEKESGETPRRRAALDQLNAVLSVIVALQFPMGGIERGRIQEACDALQALIDRTGA